MTRPSCGKKTKAGKHREHTEIVSEAQQGFFGAELARKRAGKETKTGMSEAVLSRHLEESSGKDLPARVKPHKVKQAGINKKIQKYVNQGLSHEEAVRKAAK